MKKFCNKIAKQQWRVTVPNINTSVLKKTFHKDGSSKNLPNEKVKTSISGCYDVEQAEKEFERSRSVPISSIREAESSGSSETDDCFEDAQTMFDRSHEFLSSTDLDYTDDLYVDVPSNIETSKVLTEHNGKYEYDVPKISFSFFEKSCARESLEPPTYETVKNPTEVDPKHKSEVKIVLATPAVNETIDNNSNKEKVEIKLEGIPKKEVYVEPDDNSENIYENKIIQDENNIELKRDKKIEVKHESKIEVKHKNKVEDKQDNKLENGSNEDLPALKIQEGSPESTSEIYVDTQELTISLTKIIEDFSTGTIVKAGSDPNLHLRTIEEEDEDDGFYKVPKPLKRNRLSMSLNDFNAESVTEIGSNHSSIEHISCSQVIVEKAKTEPPPESNSAQNSSNMDYCKTRSKLPLRIRRATFLKSPRNKAAGKWKDLKTKVNKVISERTGPGTLTDIDREKIANNIEGMYKTSKDKCKQILKSTGKIFKVKRDQENFDPNSDSNSQIVKNDAFFAKVKLKASDIEYDFSDTKDCINKSEKSCDNSGDKDSLPSINKKAFTPTPTPDSGKEEFEFPSLKSAFRRSKFVAEGQNGFDDIRRYVKQGGDFCKELSVILQERSEAELQYAKSLSKLSTKLSKACREGVGALNEAWKAVATELEARAEGHRLIGTALLEEAVRPLKTLTENQHRARKQTEATVDKSAKNLSDWRMAEAKIKKHSHTCARDNEKLQDAMLDNRITRSTSLVQLAHTHNNKSASEKDSAKLEGKKRKAEDAVKKADIEYYTTCLRAERARLDWETAVLKGASTFQTLEEERLNNLKTVLVAYLQHSDELGPRLLEAMDRLRLPTEEAEPSKDLTTFVSLRQSSQQVSEQLLPDFYCEHITLAMNRERRKQALVKLLYLIRQDIERERKSKGGLENLSQALKQTPSFGNDDSQQTFAERFYHMKSMLTYLEGARYKVHSALCELDGRTRNSHPLAPHITITRDKSGLQQSVLKVPQWLRKQWGEIEESPLSEKSEKSDNHTNDDLLDPDWSDRGTADGNSNQPDSDFDEFSSQGSSTERITTNEENPVQPIAQCRALYSYSPNLPDELVLHPGDILSVYRQQDDGWWLGECNGSVGIFPATYVETITT